MKPRASIPAAAAVAVTLLLALEWSWVEQSAASRPDSMRWLAEPSRLVATASSRTEPTTAPHPQLAAQVTIKYELLLGTMAPATRQRLQEVLVAREGADQTNLVEAANWERQVSLLLREDEYSLYEQLRESEAEQAHLQAFAQQLLDTSPLTPQQQRELLLAKLKHRLELQALELQASSPRPDLSAMENSYARDIAVDGIHHYGRTFLEDTRSVLTEPQWLALAQFEAAARDRK